MNCPDTRRRLLGLENPAQPSGPLQDHLTACPACSEWQRRLVELEQQVRLLTVPPSTAARDALLLRLSETGAKRGKGQRAPASPVREPAVPMGPLAPRPSPLVLRSAGHPWYTAGLVAASFCLLVFAWWAVQNAFGPRSDVSPKQVLATRDELLANLMEHDMLLAEAESPGDRLKALASLAEDLHHETQALAPAAKGKDCDGLTHLCQLYQQVVQDGVMASARDIPADQRQRLLKPIADQLDQERQETEKLLGGTEKELGGPLRDMIRAAGAGNTHLRDLMQGQNVMKRSKPDTRRNPEAETCRGDSVLRRVAASPRLSSVLMVVIASGGLALGQTDDSASSPEPQRFRQRELNQGLVKALVKGGLRLAAETDPLKRADCCTELVSSFVTDIQQAAKARQDSRADELGDHLCSLLQRGVANNLKAARNRTRPPMGSMLEKEIDRVRDKTFMATKGLDDLLGRPDRNELKEVLAGVERAAKAPDQADLKVHEEK
jgi:hypothetical protein